MTVKTILADIALLRRAVFTEGSGEDSSTSAGELPWSIRKEESAGGSDNEGKLILSTSQQREKHSRPSLYHQRSGPRRQKSSYEFLFKVNPFPVH